VLAWIQSAWGYWQPFSTFPAEPLSLLPPCFPLQDAQRCCTPSCPPPCAAYISCQCRRQVASTFASTLCSYTSASQLLDLHLANILCASPAVTDICFQPFLAYDGSISRCGSSDLSCAAASCEGNRIDANGAVLPTGPKGEWGFLEITDHLHLASLRQC
jgi:hypothetical protein